MHSAIQLVLGDIDNHYHGVAGRSQCWVNNSLDTKQVSVPQFAANKPHSCLLGSQQGELSQNWISFHF